MGHDKITFVGRFDQVTPIFRLRYAILFALYLVVDNCADPSRSTEPGGIWTAIDVLVSKFARVFRHVGQEHALGLQEIDACYSQAPYGIRTGIVLLGQQFCRYHARRCCF